MFGRVPCAVAPLSLGFTLSGLPDGEVPGLVLRRSLFPTGLASAFESEFFGPSLFWPRSLLVDCRSFGSIGSRLLSFLSLLVCWIWSLGLFLPSWLSFLSNPPP